MIWVVLIIAWVFIGLWHKEHNMRLNAEQELYDFRQEMMGLIERQMVINEINKITGEIEK